MNTAQILLLSGPPASGKDTVSHELINRNNRFVLFKKHRAGGETNSGYIDISTAQFKEMEAQNKFIQSHLRYGRLYGVSRDGIEKTLAYGKIPIIHTGRIENLVKLKDVFGQKCIAIHLWEHRDILAERIRKRHNNAEEISARITALDEEIYDQSKKKAMFSNIDQYIRNTSLEQTANRICNILKVPADPECAETNLEI